ncbi:MAG: hypothetical protein ACFFA3_10505 [Promethearchaeota archaeon]
MSDNENQDDSMEMRKEYKILVKNSFYSFLNSYGVILFTTITSFFTARIISAVNWGFLILALSAVNLFVIILTFFPPSLGYTLNYYVPKFRASNQNRKLKSFLKQILVIRLFFVSLIFLIAMIIAIFFTELLKVNLGAFSHLFFILAPLIFINGFGKAMFDLYRSLNMFRTVLVLFFIKYLIQIISLIYYFIFFRRISVEALAYITLFSDLVPFIMGFLYIFFIVQFKIENTEEDSQSYSETIKDLYSYGIHLSFQGFMDTFFRNFRIQAVGFFETPDIVTGYSIGVNYRNVALESIASLNKPLIISFSGLDLAEKKDQVFKIFRLTFQYFNLLNLLFIGILYFMADIFLFLIYGVAFLKFSMILKLTIITMMFSVQETLFFALIRSSKKVKFIIPISILSIILRLPIFLISLFFFGIIGALIGVIISNTLYFIILALLNKKIFEIQLKLGKTALQYLSFIIALGLTILLEFLFYKGLNYYMLKSLNLLIFKNFVVFSLITFIIVYIALNIIFKILARSDIDSLESFFQKDTSFHKLIRWGFKIMKKFIRR